MGHRPQLPLVSSVFRYDPYQTEIAFVVEEEVFALPADTLHIGIANQVSFLPYPEEKFSPRAPSVPKDQMGRVFLGQLPYQVTDMQLQWLCYTFGNGAQVQFPERIVKHVGKVPTGCFHAYCPQDQVEGLMLGMHKRLLIDDTGVWYAQSDAELEALCAHTAVMKKDWSKRPHNRPYDTVVAQLATSTYVPKSSQGKVTTYVPKPPSYSNHRSSSSSCAPAAGRPAVLLPPRPAPPGAPLAAPPAFPSYYATARAPHYMHQPQLRY